MSTPPHAVPRSLHRPSAKVFCIGFNKTGTTSVRVAFEQFGYRVGDQAEAEAFISDWASRDFSNIVNYCNNADAFQDIPFSLPLTYQALDPAFPGSKFILTVRTNAEEWYRSLLKFHARIFGGGKIPTEEDLAQADYRFQGWILRVMRSAYEVPPGDPYRKECLIQAYESHNAAVQQYFRHRPADLLTINLAAEDSYHLFCRFLGKSPQGDSFPWENRSS
jgi:hypothetical protein